jgi:hypothetical protein
MKKAVFSGGWGCGQGAVENVAGALERYHPGGVQGVTYSWSITNPDRLGELIDDPEVDVYSDSGSAVPVDEAIRHGARPRGVMLASAPLESSAFGLALRGAGHLVLPQKSGIPGDGPGLLRSLPDAFAEISGNIPEHFRRENIRRIAGFHAIRSAYSMKEQGVSAVLAYGERDRIFRLTRKHQKESEEAGVETVVIPEAGHNWFILNPALALEMFMCRQQTLRPELNQASDIIVTAEPNLGAAVVLKPSPETA